MYRPIKVWQYNTLATNLYKTKTKEKNLSNIIEIWILINNNNKTYVSILLEQLGLYVL